MRKQKAAPFLTGTETAKQLGMAAGRRAYGLVRLWEQTGEERLLQTIEAWCDRRIAARPLR